MHISFGLCNFLYVCLLFIDPTKNFFTHGYGEVIIAGEGLHILSYALRS